MTTPRPVPREEIEFGKRYQYLAKEGTHDSFHGEHGIVHEQGIHVFWFRNAKGEQWAAWEDEVYPENTWVPDPPKPVEENPTARTIRLIKEQAVLDLINNCTARTAHGTYCFRIASVEQVDGKPVLVLEEIPK